MIFSILKVNMRVWAAVAAVALLCLMPLFSSAQSGVEGYPSLSKAPRVERTGTNDVAVIVAVENYFSLPNVPGAVANANDWEVYFQQGLGMRRVHVLANHHATDVEIKRIAEIAAQEVGEGGTLWFVFIGHGVSTMDGEDGILVGVDAQQNPASLAARGVRQQELIDLLERGKQGQTVLVVDACFSGRDNSGEALSATLSAVPTRVVPAFEKSKTVVLSAAGAEEFAGLLPGEDRPAFSYLLLGAMRGWAADGSGQVTAESAVSYARRMLRGLPGRVSQTPSVYGEGNLVLARGVREQDPGVSQILRAMLRGPSERVEVEEEVIISVVEENACPDGREINADTNGECCWPGQIWVNDRCMGLPTSCPAGRMVNESAQACTVRPCEGGQVRAPDGVNCCWEGQGWSTTRGECVGVPASCPSGLTVRGQSCVPPIPEGYAEIPAGSFTQGSPASEAGRDNGEKQRRVTISRSFLLKETPVTQGEWREVMGNNPSRFSSCGDDCPVEQVSWFDAVEYLNRLSERAGLEACYELSGCSGRVGGGCPSSENEGRYCTGDYMCSAVVFKGVECSGYRLPTEAEWEYAARAGSTGVRYGSSDSIGWTNSNSNSRTHPVGRKQANAWGLYDMIGNVFEWTGDWYGSYSDGAATDPTGPRSGTYRVFRGCGWNSVARYCRAAYRNFYSPAYRNYLIGFRPARSNPRHLNP